MLLPISCLTVLLFLPLTNGQCRGDPVEDVCSSLWPRPSFVEVLPNVQDGQTCFQDVQSRFSSFSSAPVERAWQRFLLDLKTKNTAKGPVPSQISALSRPCLSLLIEISLDHNDNGTIDSSSSEFYRLRIHGGNVSIRARGSAGAVYALVTLSQLIVCVSSTLCVVPNVLIRDVPAFRHRGIMLDTARHFIPVSLIKQTLDLMALNKLNVFHWHLTDDESFPVELLDNRSRALTRGAYAKDLVYTQNQIRDIVQYASERAIRVLPEIDVPGHTQSWAIGLPEIVCNRRVLNPRLSRTYDVLDAVIGELSSLFPEAHFHIGGDEVVRDLWKVNCTGDLSVDADDLNEFFHEKVSTILRRYERRGIVWSDAGLRATGVEGPIVQFWQTTSLEDVRRMLESGQNLILSNNDASYLDCGLILWCGGRKTWWDILTNRLFQLLRPGLPTPGNVLGGELAMWTECLELFSPLCDIIAKVYCRRG